MSSCAEEDRTTSARPPPSVIRSQAARTASSPTGEPGARSVGTSTNPGRVGSPATAERARLAALAPVTAGSFASPVSSGTTARVAT
ncbi:hypothetical protein ACQEWB_03780 [Streptomyces sp. CA-249302]|uniref:hypothetical protein n=1 Tax=Streptomyces sp. CA-249302 TaxID=3240058 RepID=UPI003D8A131E